MPKIYDAHSRRFELTEVQQQLGDGVVRTICLRSTVCAAVRGEEHR